MPVDSNGVGYSEHTLIKQEQFRKIIGLNIRLWQAVWNRGNRWTRTYTYIDMNAGPGIHEAYGDGSPVIALDEIAKAKVNYCVHLYEINYNNAERLKIVMDGYPSVYVHQCDHAKLFNHSGNGLDKPNYISGMIYSDGSGTYPPFDLLSLFSRNFLAMDILVYFSANTIKRVDRKYNYGDLLECISKIDRKNTAIRESMGAHQWSFLYMTNGPVVDWKKEGFYDLRSDKGKEIFEHLNNVAKKDENENQLPLFELSGIS